MEFEEAIELTEKAGCFIKYDDFMKAYAIYVGQSKAFIKPTSLTEIDTKTYQKFLLGFIAQEASDILQYGVVVH